MRLLALTVAVVLVLSACGGAGGTSGQDDGDGKATTGPGGQAATSPGGGAQATPAGEQVSELTAKRRQATFKVTYKTTVSRGEPPPDETWYSKPPSFRVDHGAAGKTDLFSQFVLPSGSFTCETVDGKATCFKSPVQWTTVEQLSFAALVMTSYEDFLKQSAVGITNETRTIAGQRATCRNADNVVALGLLGVSLCWASNGVPLYFRWKAGEDVLTLEATTYSTSVADKDFELPAAPQSY